MIYTHTHTHTHTHIYIYIYIYIYTYIHIYIYIYIYIYITKILCVFLNKAWNQPNCSYMAIYLSSPKPSKEDN